MRLTRAWSVRHFLRSTLALLALITVPAMAQAQQATITGRVTATGTNEPLVDARVMVVGTSLTTTTGADGRYTLRSVPPNAIEVRVIRVGYQEQKKPVTATAGGTATLDFVMVQAVVKLQEIVTTATGEQRKVEIGNTVTTLGDVNQKVETTAVTDLASLMVAKAPGVSVLPGAVAGSSPVIRIRGLGSLATSGSGITNNPIYVIDGVRMATATFGFGFTGTQGSLLNDIDPNEIEDIEIVKGPSAATLYGTDAANGVIVITTKKGKAGATRWTWYGEAGAVDDRNEYPTDYASWGHDSTGTSRRCTLVSESQGSCMLDSVTSFNVIGNPATTPFHIGHRDAYGANVSGGSDQVRFFVSGDLQNEIGPTHMPAFAQRTLDSMQAGARDEWTNPEALQLQNFRANLTASLSPKFDLNVSSGFSNTNQRLPQIDNNLNSFIYSALNNPGFNQNGLNYSETGSLGEFRNGYGSYSPAQIFQQTVQNGTQRFIGSVDGNWRPLAWMQNQGTVGLDLANNDYVNLCRFNECANQGTLRQGSVTNAQTNFRNFSAKLVSNMTWQARQSLNFKTTLGADYSNLENDGVNVTGQQLPPGAESPFQAAIKSVNTTTTNAGVTALQTVNKTFGVYVQEQASIRDRMFLTVAARSDQNSSFGTKFQSVVYPKASLSWLMSDESFFPKFSWLNSFRLRSAFGASGVQPGGTVALQTFNASTANIASGGGSTGVDTPGIIANALGNAELKPERSTEFEGGFESSVLNNRLHIDATYYNKKTKDALISRQIAASSGTPALTLLDNLGSVSNSGYELSLNTTILDRRVVGWDITVSASHNSNKVLSVGNDALTGKPLPTIGTGQTRDSVGVSANGYFARPYTFADANHDGIITPNEVTIDPNFQYVGYSQPRDIVSITNGIDLFSRHLRITVLTDYKGGLSLYNNTAAFYSQNFPTWYSENVKTASLADQAASVAFSSAKNPNSSMGFLQNGQFWKLREVSAALTLPTSFAQRIRARDAQIVFSARNLHTWTAYTGMDPESGYTNGSQDVQQDFSTIAPRTYFIVRANLHY